MGLWCCPLKHVLCGSCKVFPLPSVGGVLPLRALCIVVIGGHPAATGYPLSRGHTDTELFEACSHSVLDFCLSQSVKSSRSRRGVGVFLSLRRRTCAIPMTAGILEIRPGRRQGDHTGAGRGGCRTGHEALHGDYKQEGSGSPYSV